MQDLNGYYAEWYEDTFPDDKRIEDLRLYPFQHLHVALYEGWDTQRIADDVIGTDDIEVIARIFVELASRLDVENAAVVESFQYPGRGSGLLPAPRCQ